MNKLVIQMEWATETPGDTKYVTDVTSNERRLKRMETIFQKSEKDLKSTYLSREAKIAVAGYRLEEGLRVEPFGGWNILDLDLGDNYTLKNYPLYGHATPNKHDPI